MAGGRRLDRTGTNYRPIWEHPHKTYFILIVMDVKSENPNEVNIKLF